MKRITPITNGGTGANSVAGMVSNFFAFTISTISYEIAGNSDSGYSPSAISKSGWIPLFFTFIPGDFCDWVQWQCNNAQISGSSITFGTLYAKNFRSSACSFAIKVAVLWYKA